MKDAGRHHAKECRIVEETVLHQVVKPVRAQRRPIPMHFDNKIALSGGELRLEQLRGLGAQ